MQPDDIPPAVPSDWMPIDNKHDLGVLGKLGEEACELGASVCRCIIQGLDEREPTTGKINREWLQDEIADVIALAQMAQTRLRLNTKEIELRRLRKWDFKWPWFQWLAGIHRVVDGR